MLIFIIYLNDYHFDDDDCLKEFVVDFTWFAIVDEMGGEPFKLLVLEFLKFFLKFVVLLIFFLLLLLLLLLLIVDWFLVADKTTCVLSFERDKPDADGLDEVEFCDRRTKFLYFSLWSNILWINDWASSSCSFTNLCRWELALKSK